MSAAPPTLTAPPSTDLERLVVVGLGFREAATAERERAAIELGHQGRRFEERLLLHTCHRAELVGLLSRGARSPQIAGARVRIGHDAAEHVLLVAGGLDSAVLAEEQVLGQLRDAYQTALAGGETGPVLNELLRRALRFGKRVRSEARPGADRSLAGVAVGWTEQRLGVGAAGTSALVIGTGEMGRLLARALAARGMAVTVASRSLARAQDLVGQLPGPSRHRPALVDDALATAADQGVVALATRSAGSRLEARHLRSNSRLPLVVDLSSPPAVTPQAAQLLGDRLLDLDRIGRTGAASALDADAERRLRGEAQAERDRFIAWLAARGSGDGIAALHEQATQIRERHLAGLRRRAGLDPLQLAAVEAMSAAMIGELLHVPMLQLRRDPQAAALVRRLFGIER